jgi:hypothetical protein
VAAPHPSQADNLQATCPSTDPAHSRPRWFAPCVHNRVTDHRLHCWHGSQRGCTSHASSMEPTVKPSCCPASPYAGMVAVGRPPPRIPKHFPSHKGCATSLSAGDPGHSRAASDVLALKAWIPNTRPRTPTQRFPHPAAHDPTQQSAPRRHVHCPEAARTCPEGAAAGCAPPAAVEASTNCRVADTSAAPS